MTGHKSVGARPNRNLVVSMASGFIVVVALALMVIQAQAVFINIGGFSLSVYALVLVAVLLVAGTATVLLPRNFGGHPFEGSKETQRALLTASPLLLLSAYATIRLAFEWRLEGAQNLLALYVLTLGPLLFWLSRYWPNPGQLLRIISWVFGLTAVTYIVFRLADLPGFADRQYAMVALVGLAVAVSLSPRGFLERLIPFVIFVGIVLSGSRTASVIAIVILSTLALRSAASTMVKVLQVLGLLVAGLGVGVLSFFLLGFVSERVEESGVAGTVAEVIVNSNGRLGAWAEFLNLLASPTDWLFGRGTGAAMEFGTANLPFFSHPHNEYIRYLVDLGMLGIVLLAVGCIAILTRLLKNKGFSQDPSRAATLVVVALAAMSLTDGPLYSSFVIIPAAIVIGAGLRSTREKVRANGQVAA